MLFKKQKLIILELLDEDRRWWYGVELVKASKKRLKRDGVYTRLSQLERRKLVKHRVTEDKRRQYHITDGGVHARLKQKRFNIPLVPEPA